MLRPSQQKLLDVVRLVLDGVQRLDHFLHGVLLVRISFNRGLLFDFFNEILHFHGRHRMGIYLFAHQFIHQNIRVR
jgi:hypothetical protein